MKLAAISLAGVGLFASCEWLRQIAEDPAVQETAGNVVATLPEAAAGNWWPALAEGGKLLGAVITSIALTNAQRNRARRLRGEPVSLHTTETR